MLYNSSIINNLTAKTVGWEGLLEVVLQFLCHVEGRPQQGEMLSNLTDTRHTVSKTISFIFEALETPLLQQIPR